MLFERLLSASVALLACVTFSRIGCLLPSASAAPASVPASAAAAPRLDAMPATALLIDEATRDLFVLPPEAAKPMAGFQVKPGAFFSGRVLDSEKVNETSTPLADRLGLYLAQTQKKLGTLKFESAWGRDVVDFVGQASGLVQGLGHTKTVWPLPVPYSESSLKGRNGLLLIYTVRSADKAGILDKMDWVMWDAGGRLVRSYWSRSLNDPTASDKASVAIEKLVAHFSRSLKGQAAAPVGVRFAVDKKVSEKEIVALESVLRGLVAGAGDALLVPYEVNRSDVRYQSPLESSKIDVLIAKLHTVAPLLTVRKVSAESGVVQILSGPVPQEQ